MLSRMVDSLVLPQGRFRVFSVMRSTSFTYADSLSTLPKFEEEDLSNCFPEEFLRQDSNTLGTQNNRGSAGTTEPVPARVKQVQSFDGNFELGRAISAPSLHSRPVDTYPLHRAAEQLDFERVKSLLEAGVDVNCPNDFGVTALHIAANTGSMPCLNLLLAHPSINPNPRDFLEERTPLFHAARNGRLDCLQALIAKGAKVDMRNKDGETPLFEALSNHACVRLLVESANTKRREYINAKENFFSETVVHRAAIRGDLDTLQYLVEEGGDIRLKNDGGKTPLHLAAEYGHTKCVKYLVAKGADLEVKDSEGLTAYDVAKRKAKNEIADFLRRSMDQKALAAIKAKGISKWTTEDVVRWLELTGFGQYALLFQQHNITGKILADMSAKDLRDDIGIRSFGHRKDIIALVRSYKETETGPSMDLIDCEELKWAPGILGRGHFGEVRRAVWRGLDVAVKIIYRSQFRSQTEYELFQKEVQMLSQVRHPNVIQFLGTTVTATSHCIVTRYMERGSLYNLIHSNYWMLSKTPGLREKIILDVCKGMAYLHGRKPVIIHRDLNSKNILLDMHFNAVVADLGLSRFKEESGKMSHAVGCLPWTAPEVFRGEKYTETADVYSFAMVLYEIFTGKEPHEDMNDVTVLRFATLAAYERFRPALPPSLPDPWVTLIKRCWDDDPAKRPSFVQMIAELQALPLPAYDPTVANQQHAAVVAPGDYIDRQPLYLDD